MSYTGLKVIPECIGNLTNLRELKLDHNLLETVPELITNLKSLEILNLYNNKLSSFPETIFKVKSLLELTINEHLLTDSYLKALNERGITIGGYNYRLT